MDACERPCATVAGDAVVVRLAQQLYQQLLRAAQSPASGRGSREVSTPREVTPGAGLTNS
jgi:hypothetical protein